MTLVKEMMKLGLVDRLRLIVFPAILGNAGKESVYDGFDETSLRLAGSKALDANSMMLEYRPVVNATVAT
jgi:riboflavin biosynthesis pyrimidine reductase